ncbi:hypothetical protein [Mesorhizobium sp. B2-4-14]|uniref:hypothetical protein n=1 Tax=Mesorhizobium sp. B2-4-14 TaxID=2589935 RepID=UPI0015E3D6A7|nr:hypothetical protein [Mesorhizobium sp. B2-4-14]
MTKEIVDPARRQGITAWPHHRWAEKRHSVIKGLVPTWGMARLEAQKLHFFPSR